MQIHRKHNIIPINVKDENGILQKVAIEAQTIHPQEILNNERRINHAELMKIWDKRIHCDNYKFKLTCKRLKYNENIFLTPKMKLN